MLKHQVVHVIMALSTMVAVLGTTAAAAPVSIVIDHTVHEAYQAVIDGYKQHVPQARFDLMIAPANMSELRDRIIALFAAGDSVDILQGGFGTSQMERFGMFVDLERYIDAEPGFRSQYPEVFFDAARGEQGKLYTFPVGVSAGSGMLYNSRFFSEAGLMDPETGWTKDEFLTTARKLTRKRDDGSFEVMGFVSNPYQWRNWLNISMRSTWFDPDTLEWFPEPQKAAQALQFMFTPTGSASRAVGPSLPGRRQPRSCRRPWCTAF